MQFDYTKPRRKVGKCHFCNKIITDFYFCYGCRVLVCDECDVTGVEGAHEASQHRK